MASEPRQPLIGVLALQGGFEAHERMLSRVGADTREVRVAADLEGLDGLVIPGGESTTMTLGIEREHLAEPLRRLAAEGLPMLGSCAGLIMLDRDHLGMMDLVARRNAFGRQIHSFEADVEVRGIDGGPLRAIFIRAPWIAEQGPGGGGARDARGAPGGGPRGVAGGRQLPRRAEPRRAPAPLLPGSGPRARFRR